MTTRADRAIGCPTGHDWMGRSGDKPRSYGDAPNALLEETSAGRKEAGGSDVPTVPHEPWTFRRLMMSSTPPETGARAGSWGELYLHVISWPHPTTSMVEMGKALSLFVLFSSTYRFRLAFPSSPSSLSVSCSAVCPAGPRAPFSTLLFPSIDQVPVSVCARKAPELQVPGLAQGGAGADTGVAGCFACGEGGMDHGWRS